MAWEFYSWALFLERGFKLNINGILKSEFNLRDEQIENTINLIDEGNTIILNHNTAYEKADNYPDFEIVGVKYRAFHDEKDDFYYIQKNLGDFD